VDFGKWKEKNVFCKTFFFCFPKTTTYRKWKKTYISATEGIVICLKGKKHNVFALDK